MAVLLPWPERSAEAPADAFGGGGRDRDRSYAQSAPRAVSPGNCYF